MRSARLSPAPWTRTSTSPGFGTGRRPFLDLDRTVTGKHHCTHGGDATAVTGHG